MVRFTDSWSPWATLVRFTNSWEDDGTSLSLLWSLTPGRTTERVSQRFHINSKSKILSMPLDLFLILIALQPGDVFTPHTMENTMVNMGEHTIQFMKNDYEKFTKNDYEKFTNVSLTYELEPSGFLKNTFFGKDVSFSPSHDLCKSSEQSKSHQCRDFWCTCENCISLPRPISPIIRITMPALRNLNLLPFVLPFL